MFDLIEKIRQKSEGTRYVIVVVLFLLISGAIILISGWSASGRFTSAGIGQTWQETKAVGEALYDKFQNFRAKLGSVKKNLKEILQPNLDMKKVLDSMSAYETETNTTDSPSSENAPSESADNPVPIEENAENVMQETENQP